MPNLSQVSYACPRLVLVSIGPPKMPDINTDVITECASQFTPVIKALFQCIDMLFKFLIAGAGYMT